MSKSTGYYDVDFCVEEVIAKAGALDELMYFKDLQQRKLFLNDDVSQETVHEIVKNILQYNREDNGISNGDRKPIFLYIASNGGDVDAGFELIDAIEYSKTPVYTVNLGYQYSMGFMIGLAGFKRYASKNAKFLMHDGMNAVINSGFKAQDHMEFNKRVEDRIKAYVIEHTWITDEMYEQHARKEWYFFSDEAKSLGVTDYVIGTDCEIDEVI